MCIIYFLLFIVFIIGLITQYVSVGANYDDYRTKREFIIDLIPFVYWPRKLIKFINTLE